MTTKFESRNDPGVEKNYGKLLLEMVSIVPDGVVCFFVSYSYMDGIVNSWHQSGILKVNEIIIIILLLVGMLVYEDTCSTRLCVYLHVSCMISGDNAT